MHAICNSKINLYVGTGTHACMNVWNMVCMCMSSSKCLGRSEDNLRCWSLSFALYNKNFFVIHYIQPT